MIENSTKKITATTGILSREWGEKKNLVYVNSNVLELSPAEPSLQMPHSRPLVNGTIGTMRFIFFYMIGR